MNSSVYDIPTRVYFDLGQLDNLDKETSAFGEKALSCYGGGSIKKSGLYDHMMAQLRVARIGVFKLSSIDPNPRVSSVNTDTGICEKEEVGVPLAVGGGLTPSCTKYVGAVTYHDGDGWDILLDKVPMEQCLPIVAVLTLAATGSEMDSGDVISSPETKDRISRVFPSIQPKISFLDPAKTYFVSKYQTTCGSPDILSHLLEICFVLEGGSTCTLGCSVEDMIKTMMKHALITMEQPDHHEARANLMWTSSWAINGLVGALQNCEWTYHPIEHGLSIIYDVTHELELTIVTSHWMRYILDVVTVHRFYQYDANVSDIDPSLPEMEVAEKSTEMITNSLFDKLGLASTLAEIGINDSNFDIMAEETCSGRVLQEYKPSNREDTRKILTMCL